MKQKYELPYELWEELAEIKFRLVMIAVFVFVSTCIVAGTLWDVARIIPAMADQSVLLNDILACVTNTAEAYADCVTIARG